MAMAQTILLSSPSLPSFNPPSPDPTPLRMLAFSVAEAALQGDPNSPMTPDMSRVPAHGGQDEWKESRLARWCADPSTPSAGVVKDTIATRRGKPLWEVVERAKERREREKSSPSTVDSPLPTSPDSYSFVLPTNSYLAASITSSPSPSKPSPSAAMVDRRQFPFPLYTRSAEPSPTKSTFSALDQTRPPPEFQPKQRRLSAADFASASSIPLALPSPTQRLQAQALTRLNYPSPSRHTAKTKLPSLAEIQRKLNHPGGTGHRRSGSGGQLPLRRSDSTSTDGDGDEALIQTPEEELKSLALVDDVVIRRSATPPSLGPGVESRLAPFLRQRTSGRLVAGDKVKGRPATMPPISLDEDPISVFGPTLTLTVTPPSATPSAEGLGRVPPPSARRPVFSTPPRLTAARAPGPGPASPTGSDSALTARSSSPTLSIPIITCTPAQQADSDSDSDGSSSENDVIVFDGELEKEERSRRGQEMKDRLLLARRRSLH